MKHVKRIVFAIGIAAALVALATQMANASWGPGYGAWRHAYVHDPAYRYAHPLVKRYIRDLYLRGPEYAAWRDQRRHGRWW
jgi:hypothetical protein